MLEEGIDSLGAAVRARPDDPLLLAELADAVFTAGRVSEAIDLLRRALSIKLHLEIQGQLLFVMNHEALDPVEIAGEHALWGRRLTASLPPRPLPSFPNDPDPRRQLRVGYVVDSFRRQTVASFLEPLLEAHDREAFDIVRYQTAEMGSDRRLSNAIRRDRIDILVDLAGHTEGHRLRVFAQRAAPVQVTYLGYPNTTGLEQMDYRITDTIADPPGLTRHLHTERLLRLPRCFLAYRPRDSAAAVERVAGEPFTFASFCRPCKLSEGTVMAWAEILRRAPASRLLLHHQAMRPFRKKTAQFIEREIRGRFTPLGVEPSRIEFVGRLGLRRHFELDQHVDLCLDPVPYNGTTALCEGLWMGVPAVALEGSAHVSRVAASVLGATGLGEFVCGSAPDYVATAVRWSRRPARLSQLRAGMRARLAQSELMDGAGLARAIEREYRRIWRRYCGFGAAGPDRGACPSGASR